MPDPGGGTSKNLPIWVGEPPGNSRSGWGDLQEPPVWVGEQPIASKKPPIRVEVWRVAWPATAHDLGTSPRRAKSSNTRAVAARLRLPGTDGRPAEYTGFCRDLWVLGGWHDFATIRLPAIFPHAHKMCGIIHAQVRCGMTCRRAPDGIRLTLMHT